MNVKLLIRCLGTLRRFWWYTPRIPGISRVFQSYMVWDLGTPRSQEEQIRMTPSPGTRNKHRKHQSQKHVLNTVGNHDSKERVPLQSCQSAHKFCTSPLKSEHIINVFQEKQTRAVWYHQDFKINQLFLEPTKLIYNYLYATTAGKPLMISRLHLMANELLWVIPLLIPLKTFKMRNEKDFRRNLISL